MRQVSEQYKQIMSGLIQPATDIRIDVDVYNVQASETAQTQPDAALFWNQITSFDAQSTSKRYVTFEPNFYRVGNAFVILPEESEDYIYQGWTREELSDQEGNLTPYALLQIDFSEPQYDFYGLTFLFDAIDNSYPESVVIEAYSGTRLLTFEEYPITSTNFFVRDEFIDGCTKMFISFKKISKPYRRLRVDKIGFGATLSFQSSDILNAEHTQEVNPISTTLPKNELTFSVVNFDKVYNADNPSGMWAFMDQQQPVRLYYGLDVNGTKELIKADTLYTTGTPSAGANSAKFQAQGALATLTETYGRGEYVRKSLYDLAEDVLQDAYARKYNREKRWKLDESLNTQWSNAPMPRLPHNQCLQLIATAGRCVLKTNEDGVPEIITQLNPSIKYETENAIFYSDLKGLSSENNHAAHYITFEPNSWLLSKNGNYILPDDGYLKVGYVSDVVSDSLGNFTDEPEIMLLYSHIYSNYKLKLVFDTVNDVYPTNFICEYYFEEKLLYSYSVDNNDSPLCELEHYVEGFDKIKIRILKMSKPFARCQVAQIGEGYVNDYTLDFTQSMLEPPVTKENKIKEVEMIYHTYFVSEEDSEKGIVELGKKTVAIHSGDTVKVEYAMAMQVTVEITKGNAEIEKLSVWAQECEAQLHFDSTVDELREVEIVVKGLPLTDQAQSIFIGVERDGEICTFDNPLITDVYWAQEVGEWIADFMKNRNSYSFDFRQDYRLEANDIVYLDTAFENRQIARVISVKNTSPGQQGQVKLRRLES
jgi:hypothetical protein